MTPQQTPPAQQPIEREPGPIETLARTLSSQSNHDPDAPAWTVFGAEARRMLMTGHLD